MIKQLAIRCPRCHLALQATAIIISTHFTKKHNTTIDEISIKEILSRAVPFSELKSTATKNKFSKKTALKQETSKNEFGNTKNGLKKRRGKLKNASLELPGIESLTPKKRLARLFGPDDPESYYATSKKNRLFLQGGSPGLGKRK